MDATRSTHAWTPDATTREMHQELLSAVDVRSAGPVGRDELDGSRGMESPEEVDGQFGRR